LTEPSDIVPVVRMLLLDDTNANGQVFTVDGGGSI
jgi:3-oxoacyl-[acyl-carrier protein] reductase